MKRISFVRALILGAIITTTLFVVASNTRASIKSTPSEECTEQKPCETNQSEFILESLTKNILGR
jgi:hypothetical protein